MKNLIVAIMFAMFSLALPLTMAQQAVADEPAAEVEPKSVTTVDNDGKRITIDIRTTEDVEEAEEELREALQTVTEIFGEKMGAEFASELENLDSEDRHQLRKELRKVFNDGDFHLSGHDSGMGFSGGLVAIVAIIFTFGMPVIILVLVLVYRNKKRKQKMDLIGTYLDAGQPVPEHVMAEFGSDSNVKSLFRSGVTLTLVGVAISIFLWSTGDQEAAAVGLIPIAVGLARLISWKFDNDKDNA